MIDRLKYITKIFGSKAKLANALGVHPTSLYDYYNGKTEIGSAFAKRFEAIGINRAWILLGEGEIFADTNEGKNLRQETLKKGLTISETTSEGVNRFSVLFDNSRPIDLKDEIESNGQKEISTGETPEAIYARAKRWQLVREWLTETGTMTEWYFMANSVDGGISLEFLMFMEAVCPEPEELPDIQPFWAWLNKSGINTDWLKGGHGPAWNEEKWGAELRERLKKRFNRQRETSPATAALLEYSA